MTFYEEDMAPQELRLEALQLAVEWTARHLTPSQAVEIVATARVFEAYLREGAKS